MALSGMRKRFEVDAYGASVAARLGSGPDFTGETVVQPGLPSLFDAVG